MNVRHPDKSNPSREDEVVAAAAALFAERGYAATSIRDIGERVGLLGGSLYHYIKSKDALFVRIHDAALQAAEDRIRVAIEGWRSPPPGWPRRAGYCWRSSSTRPR
ncbi:helix-turn-helix domain-containing protein [Novosphingobium resinovorum]